MGIHREYLRARRKQKSGWRARTYVTGDYCFKSLKKQRKTAFFYSEQFEVNADPPAKLNVIMKVKTFNKKSFLLNDFLRILLYFSYRLE